MLSYADCTGATFQGTLVIGRNLLKKKLKKMISKIKVFVMASIVGILFLLFLLMRFRSKMEIPFFLGGWDPFFLFILGITISRLLRYFLIKRLKNKGPSKFQLFLKIFFFNQKNIFLYS